MLYNMKRKISLLVACLLLVFAASEIMAQNAFKSANPYFQPEELPDMCIWLPAPPAADSPEFALDVARYEWGKSVRENDPARLALAIKQADASVGNFCEEFSAPFGMTISKERTPKIFKLLVNSVATCATIAHSPKNHYMRPRPFIHFEEKTPIPNHESNLGDNGSYPSGHTTRGWAAALLLMEINPDASIDLLKMGLMQGDSRMIVGYHWQSDVTAARLGAAAAVAKLHSSKRFNKDMQAAKREFKRLSK